MILKGLDTDAEQEGESLSLPRVSETLDLIPSFWMENQSLKLYTFCLQQAFHSKLHQNNWKQLSDSMVNALSNPEKLKNLSVRLGNAWLQCVQIPTPSLDDIPISRSEAYFVQDQMAEVIGDSVSGWKVGATSAKMRELDGHCLLYTSPSPRDVEESRMPSSA